MNSALTPREIQTRIRGGASVADVALSAGVTAEQIEGFAAPVLAEREFVAGMAQSHPVRRGGETIAHHTLSSVVSDRLAARQIDADAVAWDSWKLEGRRWAVRAAYGAAGRHHDARFIYDQAGRFSVADNDDARWLLGLHSVAAAGTARNPRDEAEPTIDLNDDLALVRVVQPGPPLYEDTEPIDVFDDAESDSDDAYSEAELAEVDGLYDIVASTSSQIDVLYEMLTGFDEDSVQIYAGLVRPAAEKPATPVLNEGPTDLEPDLAADTAPTPTAGPLLEVHEPEQPSLVDEAQPSGEPKPAPKGRRKRAHVPSWDEIMFGSPGAPGTPGHH
ncbi:MAG: septation protein SepH [Propionicimonas sp.]